MKNKTKIYCATFRKLTKPQARQTFEKLLCFFSLLIFLATPKTFSQAIMYGYDDNGNRTLRDVIVLTQNKSTIPPDSTNNSNDTTLAQTNTADSPEASERNRIEASFAGNKVLIYPNPAKYYINVQIDNVAPQQTEINICDMYGKLLDKINVTNNNTYVDFSQRAAGNYLLKITISNKSKTWTIVKE